MRLVQACVIRTELTTNNSQISGVQGQPLERIDRVSQTCLHGVMTYGDVRFGLGDLKKPMQIDAMRWAERRS